MEQTGVQFTNALPPARLLENQVRYNGSGVAAGDVDGDGLCDLFFCSLEGRSHLYKNLGNWKFEEITTAAGVGCEGLFTSGALLADVDGDGDLDLLVNAHGMGTRLFLNDGKAHFTEKKDAGLTQKYGSTSMAMADVDGNGTLDLYVANYATTTIADNPGLRFTVQRIEGKLTVTAVEGVPVEGNPELQHKFIVDQATGSVRQLGEADILYLNKGGALFEAQNWTNGIFEDVNGRPLRTAPKDYGLSVIFRDFTGDGLPDLFICNDLFTPDRIWINQGGGRFRAASNLAFRHISDSCMGGDVADINRDGIDDVLTLEMLNRDHRMRQMQVVGLRSEVCRPGEINNRPAYNRNMLFLGRGDGTFAEIANLAGLEASDWSWMPMFLDVDLDGFEDVLVVNGYFRDSLNADLKAEFERRRGGKRLPAAERLQLQSRVYPLHREPNVAFRNRGNLTFEEVSERWGFNEEGISQGMCAADLDNDGDPDVIINNFGALPTLYRNEAGASRVAVQLKGLPPNTAGIGGRIQFLGGPVPQSQEMICGGRYLSCDQAERVFACDSSAGPFQIQVKWRSGRRSVLNQVQPNYIYELDEAQAEPAPGDAAPPAAPQPLFTDVSGLLNHSHAEGLFDDFAQQRLLPRKLSQAGPGVSWIDVNGDGVPDLVIGGGRNGEVACYLNNCKGGFGKASVPREWTGLKTETGAVLGRADAAGPALLVAQSNYEGPCSNAVRLARCTTAGIRLTNGLAATRSCPGPLAVADVDGDGRLDLFVGGRVVPARYPLPASSVLCKGRADNGLVIDPEASALFRDLGLVNGAVFSDLDGDGWPDLVLAVEWGPVRVFHNDHGKLRETTAELGLAKYSGWWHGVQTGDFDGDGRLDIAASNWGRNSRYERYRQQPIRIFCGDWNGDGELELLEAAEDPAIHKLVPLKYFEPVRECLPWVAGMLTSYSAYGNASIREVLGEQFKKSKVWEVTTLETMVFMNRGDHFEARTLPLEAQFAPAFGICVADFDGDGHEDIFLAQNFYPVDGEGCRLDAGRGLLLRGDGAGGFSPVPSQVSGLEIYGDGRGAAVADYDADGRPDLVVAQNGAATKLYHNTGGKAGLRVLLAGEGENPAAIGAQMRLDYGGKQGPVREIHAGGGYWSQDEPVQILGKSSDPVSLWVRWPGGKTASYPLSASTREIIAHPSGKAEVR